MVLHLSYNKAILLAPRPLSSLVALACAAVWVLALADDKHAAADADRKDVWRPIEDDQDPVIVTPLQSIRVRTPRGFTRSFSWPHPLLSLTNHNCLLGLNKLFAPTKL